MVILIATTLVAVTVLALALLRPRVAVVPVPELRLSRLVRIEPEPPDTLRNQDDPFFPERLLGLSAETWRAEFVVRSPPGTGIVFTNGVIGVEMFGFEGDWSAPAVVEKPWGEFLPSSGVEWTLRTITLVLPTTVRSCQFNIGFRPPTFQGRGLMVLEKSGLWRRFPGISMWIYKRLPKTERWLICRPVLQVAAPPIRIETHSARSSPQPLGL